MLFTPPLPKRFLLAECDRNCAAAATAWFGRIENRNCPLFAGPPSRLFSALMPRNGDSSACPPPACTPTAALLGNGRQHRRATSTPSGRRRALRQRRSNDVTLSRAALAWPNGSKREPAGWSTGAQSDTYWLSPCPEAPCNREAGEKQSAEYSQDFLCWTVHPASTLSIVQSLASKSAFARGARESERKRSRQMVARQKLIGSNNFAQKNTCAVGFPFLCGSRQHRPRRKRIGHDFIASGIAMREEDPSPRPPECDARRSAFFA